MILTPEELQTLTARRRSDAQRRELVALGVPFRARTDGSLVVLRSDLERKPDAPVVQTREPQLCLDPAPKRGRASALDLTPEEKERAKLRDSKARIATARKAAVAAGLRKA